MATLQELVLMGEKMGLKEKALQDFVTQQQNLARDERERQRQHEKDKLDKEKDKLELEKEKLQLQLQSKETGDEGGDQGGNNGSHHKLRGPKMAAYDEKDDMDAYIFRFERYAEMQGWKKDDWATYLSALLRGKALDVYARLTPDESKDYKTLKDALLKRYQMTEEGYKRKFYAAKPDTGESPPQFITRLCKYLIRWIELAGIEESYDAVCGMFVREQYLQTCSKEMEVFLRERAETDLTKLGKLAEQYEEAHSAAKRNNRQFSRVSDDCEQRPTATKSENQIQGQGQGQNQAGKRKACFNCGKPGHIAKNCFQKQKLGAMTQQYTPQRPFTPRSEGYQFRRQDQMIQRQGQAEQSTAAESNTKLCGVCKAHGKGDCTDCWDFSPSTKTHTCNALLSPEVKLECGCKLPVVAQACDAAQCMKTNMPVSTGWIDGKQVSVLRDTGCSAVVVRRDLVTDRQLTGKKVLCVLIDGTVRRAETANIEIKTPHYSGNVEALCMKNPLYDLILGNIPGVDQDIRTNQEPAKVSTTQTEESIEVQAVETRASVEKPARLINHQVLQTY